MRIKTGLAVVALALGAAACKDKESPPPAPVPSAATVAPQSSAVASASASTSEADASADGDGVHARRERGPQARGVSSIFFRAAKDLADLKDDQKPKIEEAQKKTHDTTADGRDEMKASGKEVHTEIVAGIKAGKIEAAKLEPKYAALEKLMKAQREKEDEGLNALHAALTPPQRKTLVEQVKKKHAEMEERMAKREANAKEKADERAKKHVARLTADLGLDADQQKKVDAIAPPPPGGDRADNKKRTEAILAAFDKDTFDAKKADAFDAKKARAPLEAQAKLVGQILAVLKPEQREKLAAAMEKGPSPHGRRGGGGSDHRGGDDDDD